MSVKRNRRVSVTELSSMGKCENMTRLKASHEERAHQSVRDAADRGQREHLAFEAQGSDSRCFVASWALGADHWATDELRLFRDSHLMATRRGRWMVERYYALSPALIKAGRYAPGARSLCARALRAMALKLKQARLGAKP